METVNYFLIFGSIALFLFGLEELSRALKELGLNRTRAFFAGTSRNGLQNYGLGLFSTLALGSSSAFIIILIAFVDAGVSRGLGPLFMVLGSNLGTALKSQLAFFSTDWLAPLLLVAGMIRILTSTKREHILVGEVLAGIGTILFSLIVLEYFVSPLKHDPSIREMLLTLNNPWKAALVGAVVTAIIQSSSATVLITIGLGNQGLISTEIGVAIMMGAEIGTCADTLIATIGRAKEAVKVGIFHLVFNVLSVCIGLLFFSDFFELVTRIPVARLGETIAWGHLIFNLGGTLLGLVILVVYGKLKNKQAAPV